MFTFTGPWEVKKLTIEEFLIGMSSLGTPQEIQMVGSFARADDETVRTAHRDVDLPLHRDGIYTKAIADMQQGKYVERPNVDIIGMYCVRINSMECERCGGSGEIDRVEELGGYDERGPIVFGEPIHQCPDCHGTCHIDQPCFTTVSKDGKRVVAEVNLKAGEALIMDNRWWHGRRGRVGSRLLIRFWVTKAATPIVEDFRSDKR